jgi:RNA polymerase sigma factor (sigma-70 family)
MPTVAEPTPVDPERLRQLADRVRSTALARLAEHRHPQHGGRLADGELRSDWIATTLMDVYRRSRDREAMAVLHELYAGRFLRLIRHRLRTCRVDGDADDLLQETFFAICRYPDGFCADRPQAFRCWAFRILYNTITTAVRRLSRRPRQLDTLEVASIAQIADERTPASAASDREAIGHACSAFVLLLRSCLHAYHSLGSGDRALLDAVDVARRSYPQVAAELGCSVATMKVRVFRARRRIEAHLHDVLRAPADAA